ncbi:MAG: GNAT family N-acetyltransferase [Gemmatimonadota bacterium]|nr:GNAT family N-acetyltransferase [Gemmatimonadota bacterium]
MSTLRVEKIESLEALDTLGPEWRELEAASGNGLPFMTWEWSSSWWSHFHESRSSVRDTLFVRALRSESGELLAVAPLMLTERPAVGPLRLRQLHFFGADPNLTELRGVLCRPGSERTVYGALLDHLQAEPGRWDWIVWSGILADTDAAAILEQRGEIRYERSAFLLPLAPSWEQFRSGLKRNIKESLRKCYNSLKRDGHFFDLEVVRQRDQVPRALDEFFRLHAARAELDGTVRHGDAFDFAAARRFLVEVCQRLADRDATRIFLLRIGGAPVAARVGFALNGTLYLYYSGYDPDWAKYSAMTTTVAEAIKYAISEGFSAVNLSTGNDVSKTRWGPRELAYLEAVVLSGSPRARIVYPAYQAVLKAARSEPGRALTRKFLARRAH